MKTAIIISIVVIVIILSYMLYKSYKNSTAIKKESLKGTQVRDLSGLNITANVVPNVLGSQFVMRGQ